MSELERSKSQLEMDFELWNLTSHLYSFYTVYAITKLLSLTFFGPVNLITEESVY